jgi:hypothetical protein
VIWAIDEQTVDSAEEWVRRGAADWIYAMTR